MAAARLYCIFVLLLYSQGSYGQQPIANNQNRLDGVNNITGFQQQGLQRPPNTINQMQNGGLNINGAPPNLQTANLQQSLSASNCQPPMNLPANLQSASSPQNGFQITKIGFTPVSPGPVNNPFPSTMIEQNGCAIPNAQAFAFPQTNVQSQVQNMPFSNPPVSQIVNGPISNSNLADLMSLKAQNSLLSLLNPQNNGQSQQNQQFPVVAMPVQNELTDAQKQYLVRAFQAQGSGQNQQSTNVLQAQPTVIQTAPPQGQAIVTSLGTQPAYITVQAQPLTSYLQAHTPQVNVVEEDPLAKILSELGPQYSMSGYPTPKKESKMNIKNLIPLIINLLKEKNNNCGCRNCGCPNNSCQNNECSNNSMPDPQMAQVFGGYSNQKTYGQETENKSTSKNKKKDYEDSKNTVKEKSNSKIKKKPVIEESEETSEEDDEEYSDEEER